MITGTIVGKDHPSVVSSLRVLEAFAHAARLSYDQGHARRVLCESQRAIAGDGPEAWASRMVEVGESLDLRIRSLEATVADVVGFVQQGVPVAHGQAPEHGGALWTVILGTKGRKLRILNPKTGEEQVVSPRILRRQLGILSRHEKSRWVIGQPALACQMPPSSEEDSPRSTPPTPFARLLTLLAPEKKDLWVVLVFSMIVGILALATPVAVEVLVNTVAFGRYLQPVVVLALILFVFLAFAAAMRGLIVFVAELLQRRIFVRVVEDLAYRLPRIRQQQFDQHHGPELVNRFFDVVTVQKSLATLALEGLAIVLQTAVGMVVLAFYHPFLLGFDVVLLGLITLAVFGLGRGAVKTAIQESKAKFSVAAWLEELARHPTAFKMHGGQQFALEKADQLAVYWLKARRSHFHIVMRQILFVLGLQAVAATVLLGLGGWLVIAGELTLGQLVAAELIVMMILSSFAKLGKHLESFYDLLAAVDKLGQLFDLRTEAHDKLFHLREGEPAAMGLHGVSYAINGRKVLEDLTFTLPPGETTALVGRSGGGKSACVDLLCGLRAPNTGHIELDGIDLRELRPDSLREHLSVARGIEIFHGTINENVHLNRPHISALDVRDAIDAVGLLDDLQQLPDGFNTVLQTGGAPLSASQAARLMIARALVGHPRMLIIDGTLDPLPEEFVTKVLAGIINARHSRTVCIATSRKEIASACHHVVQLDPASSRPKVGERPHVEFVSPKTSPEIT